MVKLQKTDTDYCQKCVQIMTEEGIFKMYLDPNFTLCLVPSVEQDDISGKCFKYTITDDNRYAYDVFDELYDSIVNSDNMDSERMEHPLVKDNGIEWHSDGFQYDAASVFRLDKDENNNYVVTFVRSKLVSDHISVFTTSVVQIDAFHSRYPLYNNEFIKLHSKLNDYDLMHNMILYNNRISNKKKVRKR